MKNKMTYISLFSSAGVGCYGFKQNDFQCIATNELIERRINIQKVNKKCKYTSGYICGDITIPMVKVKLFDEILFWKKKENINEIDVVIATPPCQGMSVANHKKNDKEIIRNSLVIESINLINEILPKFFIFENVPAFMKTICTDNDSKEKSISEAIKLNLGNKYIYESKILNFKNYGGNSSRTRTLVIGVRKDLSSFVSPLDLFPDYVEEKTVREVIGLMMPLNNPYDFDPTDIYHNFRYYDPRMRNWISCLKEGESAFDNAIIENRPHRVINGVIVENVRKNADKYTRQKWDKVGPCIHTRNDQLASQNTIHPSDDRVFSIRELMKLMSIPDDFKWTNESLEELNSLSLEDKIKFMKKEEINIRQSIGEAVPTRVFYSIASKIKSFLQKKIYDLRQIKEIIETESLYKNGNIIEFIKRERDKICFSSMCKIIEYSNSKRTEQSAFYTDKFLTDYIYHHLPEIDKETIRILEPSVGAGNFIPIILSKYENKKIIFDLLDIDDVTISALKELLKIFSNNKNVKFNFITADFLTYNFNKRYDLIIGNPPFSKINKGSVSYQTYLENGFTVNRESTNLASYFIEKACQISDYVSMIMPKNLLNTPEYYSTRLFLSNFSIDTIIDFGEKGFKGVLVETIFINLNVKTLNSFTNIISLPLNKDLIQKQNYITDIELPYWIIYRNNEFDLFKNKMIFNIFSVYRDRQITSTMIHSTKIDGDIRVIKSRNIDDNGVNIIDIEGYDGYISLEEAKKLSVFKYLNNNCELFLTPNMTYKSRIMRKNGDYIVNGSVAVLKLTEDIKISDDDLLFFSSKEYRDFLQIARNYQTRSLNIDSNSVYFFGVRR